MIEVEAYRLRLFNKDGDELGVYSSSVDAIAAASAMDDGTYIIRQETSEVKVTHKDPGPGPGPGGDVKIRFSLDNPVGAPMEGTSLPPVVVYDTQGYQNVTAVSTGVVVGSAGAVEIELGENTGLSADDIVWVACAESKGTYGQEGYETNGILTQVKVEAV